MRLLAIFICSLPLGALLVFFVPIYKAVPVDPEWEMSTTESTPESALTVRFTGTSTLLFSDGKTQWMVDGWFTRPGPLTLLAGNIQPDVEAITEGLRKNEVSTLAAVLPAHSHYDHAMDAPEVAKRTGAILMGSESTANIGRGWGLPESQIQVLINYGTVEVGDFSITPIETNHFEFADPKVRERALGSPQILEPLVPPAKVFDYRLGKAYALHISHPKGSFAIISSAGYKKDVLAGYSADTVFLGIGGLGSQSKQYRETYWHETIGQLKPERIIPIHYDSLTGPIDGPLRGPVLVMSFLSSGIENVLPFLKAKESQSPELRFQTLPRYKEVVLYE